MRINNNLAALNAWRNLSISGDNMQKSLQRLSSGYRINKAADDAAGLAVSEKMKAQIRGLNMALRNTQDGISLLQTAEGGAAKIQDMLQRMRELAVQASSGSLEDADRAQLQLEFEELAKEINRTSATTTFNNQSLINGSGFDVTDINDQSTTKLSGAFTLTLSSDGKQWTYTLAKGATTYEYTTTDGKFATSVTFNAGTDTEVTLVLDPGTVDLDVSKTASYTLGTITFDGAGAGKFSSESAKYTIQVGANNGESVMFEIQTLNAKELGITSTTKDTQFDGLIRIDTQTDASAAIKTLDSALEVVTSARAKMGAYQNRLETTVSTLQTQAENLTAAESRIRDVDMAQEMAEFTRYQVLQQAGVAMLAQANQLPQSILSLLR